MPSTTSRLRGLSDASAPSLLAMPVELVEQIAHHLLRPLYPQQLLALSSACHALHTALSPKVCSLRKQRDDGLRVLAKAGCTIHELTHSKRLLWNSRHLTDDDCAVLAELIGSETNVNPSLRRWSFSDNRIGDEGCAALVRAFSATPNLRGLALGENRIGDAGCFRLIDAMRCGSLVELDTLNLEENEIETNGLSELARWLNRGLAKLDAGFLYSKGNPGAKCKLTLQALVDACRRGGVGGFGVKRGGWTWNDDHLPFLYLPLTLQQNYL